MISSEFLDRISKQFTREQYSTSNNDLKLVSHDESSLNSCLPSIVIYPSNTDEVSYIVKLAYYYSIPITARGAGSSLEGNSIPEESGIVIDFSKMNRIIKLRKNDLQVTVEAGVVYKKLNEELKSHGLFFPPSPGGSSDIATIGGMVSTNASGIYSVKYGGTRDYILKLKLVTAKGDIIEIGNHCTKSSSAYNLVGLICGSEGTLAIITEITLKLKGVPETFNRFAYTFPNEQQAVLAISEMMKYALDIAALEYLDKHCIEALNQLNSYGLEEKPVIFFELQGTESSIEDVKTYINSICNDFRGKEMQLSDQQNPWEIRHHTTTAIKLRKKDYTIIRNDIAFPISKLPNVVEKCYQLANEKNLMIHTFGHAGLGILHVLILANKTNAEEWNNALELNKTIIEHALELGGSTSGEHGIGLSLRPYMVKEHGTSLDIMKEIKKLFDPKGILNPSKIFPK